MNAQVQLNLTLILFLPGCALLAGLIWLYPRRPRDAARRAFDLVSVAATMLAAAAGNSLRYFNAEPGWGEMWR